MGIKSRARDEGDIRLFQAGEKQKDRYAREIRAILGATEDFERANLTKAYEAMGITPIWYGPGPADPGQRNAPSNGTAEAEPDHAEVGRILDVIRA